MAYETPTDEQLVNFICVTSFGPGATQAEKEVAAFLLTSQAGFKDIWLARHKEFQDRADALAGTQWATEEEKREHDQAEIDQAWEEWWEDTTHHVEP